MELEEYVRKVCALDGEWYAPTNFRNEKPGSTFEYSNIATDVAARIVEIKSGMSYDVFTETFIFKPLNMVNTGWFYSDVDSSLVAQLYAPDYQDTLPRAVPLPQYHDAGYPDSQLKTNIEDLSKYLIEMINGYNGNGKLLSINSYATLFAAQLNDSHYDERSEYPFNDEYNYGVFWARSKPGYILHNGFIDGVTASVFINPETGIGAISMSNFSDNVFGKVLNVVSEFEQRIGQVKMEIR